MRLDLDVRRVWRCPSCSREIRSDGQVVTRICSCTKEGVAMRLVELPRREPKVRIPEPAEPEFPELADFPTDIPINPPPKRPPVNSTSEMDPGEIDAGEDAKRIREWPSAASFSDDEEHPDEGPPDEGQPEVRPPE
jgi:hypothetical protein